MDRYSSWKKAQAWEADWHNNCANSLNEELKQLAYAVRMGLTFTKDPKTPYNLDLQGKSILDIGGGAYSLLLKAVNFKRAVVAEPIDHPKWVIGRYESMGIEFWNIPGEELDKSNKYFLTRNLEVFDEVWIYNVLQHTLDPDKIVSNARKLSKLIRIFEWVDTPINVGHIHTLTEENLNKWLHGEGKVENIRELSAVGKCYYGIFPTDK
jgi:2-polyprenyl-3-methyl-5-hydroxy-6-metoxy-1,4-benzoquinol methylase